jgi:hypothetical protein
MPFGRNTIWTGLTLRQQLRLGMKKQRVYLVVVNGEERTISGLEVSILQQSGCKVKIKRRLK